MRGQRCARKKDFPKMRAILWYSTCYNYYKTSVKMQIADFQHTAFYAHGSFSKPSNLYESIDWILISGSFFLIEEATSMLESPVWFFRLPPVLCLIIPCKARMRGLRGSSAHNETEKVTEKDRFGRHLPDGQPGQDRRKRPLRQIGS